MIKKNRIIVVLMGSLLLSLGGCGDRELESSQNQSTTKNIETEMKAEIKVETKTEIETQIKTEIKTEAKTEIETKKEELYKEEGAKKEKGEEEKGIEDNTFSFSDLKNMEFYFSSGAGGWANQMMIYADGSFSGEYFDSDMGSIGENYPYGTMYQCNFNGQFTQPVKVNEYTYSTQISQINYEKEVGTEEIKDGVLYCYVEAYGLDNANDILIYLPGAPVSELPEEFKNWIRGSWTDSNIADLKLPFYALNNEANQYGFTSYNIIESLKERISYIEAYAGELEDSIKNDILTQVEYNEKTKEVYDLWDSALNGAWKVLKQTQDEETMRALTVEELEWIAFKEQAIKEAGAEYEGGSMQSMVINQKAAEITKDRVYKLMEWLD